MKNQRQCGQLGIFLLSLFWLSAGASANTLIYPGSNNTEVGADWHALDSTDNGLGNTQNHGSQNGVLGTLGNGGLGRYCVAFDLDDLLDPADVVSVTLHLRLKGKVGTPPANASLYHSQASQVGGSNATPTQRSLVYHDASFSDTGLDLFTPSTPNGWYAFDVTSEVISDLTNDVGDKMTVFRTQIDGIVQQSDLAPNIRYVISTVEDTGNSPYLEIELAAAPCGIDVSPGSNSVRVVQQPNDPIAPIDYVITNAATSPVNFTATTDQPYGWLSLSTNGGQIAGNGSETLTIDLDPNGLTPGVYNGDVIVTDDCDPNNSFTRKVTLRYLFTADQPNIVIIFFDDLRAQEVGAWGQSSIPSMVTTPNIDALATDGLRFAQTFPGLPVCTPSRATLLTGRMPFAVKSLSQSKGRWMVGNSRYMDPNEITFAEQLVDLGYSTGFVGKWHLDEVPNLSAIPPARRQGWEYMVGFQSYGGLTNARIFEDDGTLVEEPNKWLPDVELSYALQFMEDHQNEPFCLLFNQGPPHSASAPWSEEHDPNDIFTPDVMYLWNMYAAAPVVFRPNMTADPNGYPDPARQIREYHAMLHGVDEHIEIVRDKLDTLGIADNTVVIFISDHGVQLGSFDAWEKNVAYEESILCPFVVYDPRPGGLTGVNSDLTSLADLAPTVVELAGGVPHPRMQGRSLVPLINGGVPDAPRDAVMVQYDSMRFEGSGYRRSRVLRTDEWKLVACESGLNTCNVQVRGLFNLLSDPYELNNLVNDPNHSTTQSQLWQRMQTEMIAIDDPLQCAFLPWIEADQWVVTTAKIEGRTPPSDTFDIANVGTGIADYALTVNQPWLSVSPSSGTSSGESDEITIDYDISQLPVGGPYQALIQVSSPDTNNVQEIYLSLSIADGGRVAIDLAGDTASDNGVDTTAGITLSEPADGDTSVALIDGRYCRGPLAAGSDRYMYFQVDDSFAFEDSRSELYVTFSYYDQGTGTYRVQYNSEASAYSGTETVPLTNTNQWLTYTFHITDAYLQNSQNGFSDLRFALPTGGGWIDLIEIGSTPPPQPLMQTDPNAIEIVAEVGTTPANLDIAVRNMGGGKISYSLSDNVNWLMLPAGVWTNIGESDLFSLGLGTSALPVGDAVGTLLVNAPGAEGNPLAVDVVAKIRTAPALAADQDDDGDVDADDWLDFGDCMNGPGLPTTCPDADMNADLSLDMWDAAEFQGCFGGANALPGC